MLLYSYTGSFAVIFSPFENLSVKPSVPVFTYWTKSNGCSVVVANNPTTFAVTRRVCPVIVTAFVSLKNDEGLIVSLANVPASLRFEIYPSWKVAQG